MTHIGNETGTVLVSGISISAIEIIENVGFERVVSFGLQSVIGILTAIYLIVKIYKGIKNKDSKL